MSIDETAGLDMIPEEDHTITAERRWERICLPWIVQFQSDNEMHNANVLDAAGSGCRDTSLFEWK